MAINVDVVEKVYTNVVANNPISGIAMPLQVETDLDVYYGSSRAVATLGSDYTIALADDFATFTFTPKAALITKIATLGAGNVVYLKRDVPLTNDMTTGGAFFRQKIVDTFDRVFMALQQITARMKTGVDHNITISTSSPSGGVDGDLWFKV